MGFKEGGHKYAHALRLQPVRAQAERMAAIADRISREGYAMTISRLRRAEKPGTTR